MPIFYIYTRSGSDIILRVRRVKARVRGINKRRRVGLILGHGEMLMKNRIALVVFLLMSLLAVLFPCGASRADAAKIYVAPLTGIVGVPMEEYVERVRRDRAR